MKELPTNPVIDFRAARYTTELRYFSFLKVEIFLTDEAFVLKRWTSFSIMP